VWLDEATLTQWMADAPTGRRGAPQTYTDLAIQCMLTVHSLYRLPLRQTQGFVWSLFEQLQVELPVPCYTTLCRRRSDLVVALPRRARSAPLHLVVDATGVKVFGEGEWKVRQHGYGKHRTWRKLHLGIDAETHEIVVAGVTTNATHDSELLPDLLAVVPDALDSVTGDGAYDRTACYDAIAAHAARLPGADGSPQIRIPPRRGARIWQHGNRHTRAHPRDANVRRIRQIGRRAWKQETGYHQRSLIETAMYRIKTIFGDTLSARQFESQATELFLRCAILNRLTHLGLPESVPV
jgi:hypothetical protein